jgi:hypothetical protein
MLHAAGDEYTPPGAATKMFDSAAQPKKLTMVQARNHRFDGARDDFFRALKESLAWIHQ